MKWGIVFIIISLIASFLQLNETIIFITSAVSIVFLAAIIGKATEQISIYSGPKIGGLIVSSMSNIPELLIGFFAIKAGLYELVLCNMAGAIIGNILLVLGLSILLGGFRRNYQIFNKVAARSNFLLLLFAAMTLIIPITFKYAIGDKIHINSGLTSISFSIAIILLVTYIFGFIFVFITHKNIFIKNEDDKKIIDIAKWSLKNSIFILILSAIFVAVESELLIKTVEHVTEYYKLSQVFVGMIILPLLGNIPENLSAIIMAIKDKVDVSIEIAIGSSVQIALFVAPVLILTSFIINHPMIYVYETYQVIAVLISISLSVYVFQDGKTNWLEGIILLSCYTILGVSFFFM